MLKWAVGLDVARGEFQTGGTFIEVAVHTDMPKFPTLEAGFIVMMVIIGKECIMVATSPSNLGLGDGTLFFLSQW